MGFNILDLLKDEPAARFEVKEIPLSKLVPSKHNFYSTKEIEDIKSSLKMFGVLQNALVAPIEGTDKYRVIAGHRRRLAHLELVEEDYSEFATMPCLIKDNDPDDGDVTARLMLILTNATARDLTDWEKAQQAAELKQLLLEYKAQGHDIPGGMRKYIAETLNTSETQVQRYESINKNLLPELQEEFKAGTINVSVAAELASAEPELQKEALKEVQEKGPLSIKEAKKIKSEYIRKCDITGEDCGHRETMKKHFTKKGVTEGCAGCCGYCLKKTTCPHTCGPIRDKIERAEATKIPKAEMCYATGEPCPNNEIIWEHFGIFDDGEARLMGCAGCCNRCYIQDTCNYPCEIVKQKNAPIKPEPEQPLMRYQTIHMLDCRSVHYQATERGEKNFEYRKNDRDYQVGDFIILQEFEVFSGEYTGREKELQITYIQRGPEAGVPEDYVILGTRTIK